MALAAPLEIRELMFSHSDRSCFEALDFNHWFLTSRQLHAVSGLHFWIFFFQLESSKMKRKGEEIPV